MSQVETMSSLHRSRPRPFRLLLKLVAATCLLFALVVANHYHFNHTAPMNVARQFAERVKPEIDRLGELPDLAPLVAEEWRGRITLIADDDVRQYARQSDRQVIAAAGAPHAPLFRRGRPVVIYQNQQLEVIWLAQTDYEKRLIEQEQRVSAEQSQSADPPPS